jgi:hypothetical protein
MQPFDSLRLNPLSVLNSRARISTQITGTVELAVPFATAKWHANFAVSECI